MHRKCLQYSGPHAKQQFRLVFNPFFILPRLWQECHKVYLHSSGVALERMEPCSEENHWNALASLSHGGGRGCFWLARNGCACVSTLPGSTRRPEVRSSSTLPRCTFIWAPSPLDISSSSSSITPVKSGAWWGDRSYLLKVHTKEMLLYISL